MKTLLSIRDMTIGYQGRTLYSGISLDIQEGDCIMLCGANGSGKTTLLKAIAGAAGDSLAAMIPSRIPKVKGFSVREFIRLCCYAEVRESSIDSALERMSMQHLSGRDISTLSDGEFQKAAVAAALARDASIILLDEPTAFLDIENRMHVFKALRELCDSERHPAVIFSTHDIHEGSEYAGKVMVLGADGKFRCSVNKENIIACIFGTD